MKTLRIFPGFRYETDSGMEMIIGRDMNNYRVLMYERGAKIGSMDKKGIGIRTTRDLAEDLYRSTSIKYDRVVFQTSEMEGRR